MKQEKPPPLLRQSFLVPLAHFRFFSFGHWLLIITSFDAVRQELLYTLAAGWKYFKDQIAKAYRTLHSFETQPKNHFPKSKAKKPTFFRLSCVKESEKEEDFQLIHIYIIDARKKKKKRTDSGWAAAGLLDARASICPAAGLFSLLLLLLHSVLLVYMNTSSEEEEEKRDYIYMYICYFIFQREYETPPRAEATRSNTDRSCCCCCCCFCSKSLSSFYIFLKSCCFFFFFQFWFSSFSGA